MSRLLSVALLALATAPAALADGETTYKTYCVTCHGEKGDGNGPAGAALNPKPADFNDAAFFTTRDDAHLTKVIKEGGPAVGKSPMMAPWGGVLKDEQVTELVAYINATWKKEG